MITDANPLLPIGHCKVCEWETHTTSRERVAQVADGDAPRL